MIMIKKFLSALCIAAFATGFTACNSEDGPDGPVNGSFLDIVTVQSAGSTGSTFTFRSLNDSPEITLTTDQFFEDVSIKSGTRILLNYIPESGKQFESGPVRVIGFTRCLGPDITVAKTSNESEWSSSPVYLAAMWRSGQWLNLQMVLRMSTSPRRFALVLDPDTEDSDEPELHIVFTPDVNVNFSSPAYASYNISSLWDKPEVEAIKVFYIGLDGQEHSARIIRDGSTVIKPSDPDKAE